MAITITPNATLSGQRLKVYDVAATADGDTVASGATAIPVADVGNYVLVLIPLKVNFYASKWFAALTAASAAVTLDVTKDGTASNGSGVAGAQLRILVLQVGPGVVGL
jgi:hypothetical protein